MKWVELILQGGRGLILVYHMISLIQIVSGTFHHLILNYYHQLVTCCVVWLRDQVTSGDLT